MARIAQERRNREYHEVKDCTFKPKVNKGAPKDAGDEVEIKGLGRVLELKELQKRKEEEIALRQAEVFGLNHKFAVNAEQCDIADPKPSNLFPIRDRSANTRKKKANKKPIQENADFASKEYATFHPEDEVYDLDPNSIQPTPSEVPSPPSRVQQLSNRNIMSTSEDDTRYNLPSGTSLPFSGSGYEQRPSGRQNTDGIDEIHEDRHYMAIIENQPSDKTPGS